MNMQPYFGLKVATLSVRPLGVDCWTDEPEILYVVNERTDGRWKWKDIPYSKKIYTGIFTRKNTSILIIFVLLAIIILFFIYFCALRIDYAMNDRFNFLSLKIKLLLS